MPKTFEKKDAPITLKVQASLLSQLKEISDLEDRPLGYVARELMVRGIGLYRADGQLRDTHVSASNGLPAAEITIHREKKRQKAG